MLKAVYIKKIFMIMTKYFSKAYLFKIPHQNSPFRQIITTIYPKHMAKNATVELSPNNEIGVKKVSGCENTVGQCLSCT